MFLPPLIRDPEPDPQLLRSTAQGERRLSVTCASLLASGVSDAQGGPAHAAAFLRAAQETCSPLQSVSMPVLEP